SFESHCQSDRERSGVLYSGDAHCFNDAYERQRSASFAVGPCGEQLLAAPQSSRARARDNGQSVLRGEFVSFLKELWKFLRGRKKLWLVPILVTLVLFGALLILAQTTAVAPFIYTLF